MYGLKNQGWVVIHFVLHGQCAPLDSEYESFYKNEGIRGKIVKK